MEVIGKGTLLPNSMICWPSEGDLGLFLEGGSSASSHLSLEKSEMRPREPLQTDENASARLRISRHHRSQRRLMRKKCKAIKEKMTLLRARLNILNDVTPQQRKECEVEVSSLRTALNDAQEERKQVNEKYATEMEVLWGVQTDFNTVKDSGTRPIIGYISMAGQSLRLGCQSVGLGHVSFSGLSEYLKHFQDRWKEQSFGGKQGASRSWPKSLRPAGSGASLPCPFLVLVRRPDSACYSYASMHIFGDC